MLMSVKVKLCDNMIFDPMDGKGEAVCKCSDTITWKTIAFDPEMPVAIIEGICDGCGQIWRLKTDGFRVEQDEFDPEEMRRGERNKMGKATVKAT